MLNPPPADATTVHGWTRRPSSDLPGRAFVGTVREAAGFAIAVQGAQRSNGTATRYVSIDVSGARPDAFTGCVALDVEAVRQLAAMLRDAADEVDRLRCAR
ncbi:hypothetical protein [Mycobacterium kiyosense]|nr:hypothetical protein IWGMT90018_50110 [Mycobacterium kiyosense]